MWDTWLRGNRTADIISKFELIFPCTRARFSVSLAAENAASFVEIGVPLGPKVGRKGYGKLPRVMRSTRLTSNHSRTSFIGNFFPGNYTVLAESSNVSLARDNRV